VGHPEHVTRGKYTLEMIRHKGGDNTEGKKQVGVMSSRSRTWKI